MCKMLTSLVILSFPPVSVCVCSWKQAKGVEAVSGSPPRAAGGGWSGTGTMETLWYQHHVHWRISGQTITFRRRLSILCFVSALTCCLLLWSHIITPGCLPTHKQPACTHIPQGQWSSPISWSDEYGVEKYMFTVLLLYWQYSFFVYKFILIQGTTSRWR